MHPAWSTLRELRTAQARQVSVEQRQTGWLLRCLQRNLDTRFGRQHRFDRIHGIRDYQRRVPIADYEAFAPDIARIADGAADVLFRGLPVAFEQTGGSRGGARLIPYTAESLADFRVAILPWLGRLAASAGDAGGTVYLAISPATRQPRTTAGGTPVGLPDAAYLGDTAGAALGALSAVPGWVGGIDAMPRWQLATLYWLIRSHDLALVSVWSPGFMIRLLDGIHEQHDALHGLLWHGGQIDGHPLAADPAAATRLERHLVHGDGRALWPALRRVSCWMDGASGSLAELLADRLPQARLEPKGLLATEGVTTVPGADGLPVLAASSGLHEFLADDGSMRCAWELDSGTEYEVVLTTAGGLYRYRTGDRVRCAGDAHGLPVLRFVGRGDLGSDLVGEKLTEAFVAAALADIPGFRILIPAMSPHPHYTLLIDRDHAGQADAWLEHIETRLSANPQYAYARRLGQLGPLSATLHAAPLRVYTARASLRQRLGDVKVPALLPPSLGIDLFTEDPL